MHVETLRQILAKAPDTAETDMNEQEEAGTRHELAAIRALAY